MSKLGLLAVLCTSFVLSSFVEAHADPTLTKSDDIDTNRPSFMDSARVVPQGSLQLENGTLYQWYQHNQGLYDLPETEVRLGLLKRTEFQMFVPEMLLQVNGSQGTIGASNINEIGIKQQLGPFNKLRVSFIGGLNIPTGTRFTDGSTIVGKRVVSASGVAPVLRLPWLRPLNDKWAIGGMQSFLLVNGGRNAQYQPVMTLWRTLTPHTQAFAEYGGFFTNGHQSQNIAHFGAVHQTRRHHQFDIQCGFGMNAAAPVAFVGVGYSYRFDYLPWGK